MVFHGNIIYEEMSTQDFSIVTMRRVAIKFLELGIVKIPCKNFNG